MEVPVSEIETEVVDVEDAIAAEASGVAADTAEAVAEVVAEQAVEDAVATATEAVVEHVDEALDEIRDVVDDTKEDERWARLETCIQEQTTTILSGVRAIMAETTLSSEPALTAEQEATAEALEAAAEDLQETEAEVLAFDPNEAVAAPGEPGAEGESQVAPARRRRVRGLSRRS